MWYISNWICGWCVMLCDIISSNCVTCDTKYVMWCRCDIEWDMWYYYSFRALSSTFYFNCVCIVKQKQKNNFVDIQKSNFAICKFLKIISFINLSWGHTRSHKKFGPIGSAVLACIGYKQTDRQAKYIEVCMWHVLRSTCDHTNRN